MNFSFDTWQNFLAQEWWGNSVLLIGFALAVFLVLSFSFRFILPSLLTRLAALAKRTSLKSDDFLVAQLEHIPHSALQLLSLFVGLSFLHLPSFGEMLVQAVILVIIISLGIEFARKIIESVLILHVSGLRTPSGSLPAVLRITLALVLWGVGILLILSNLGVNVVSLLAGLGIGGIAIALALQNILGDMFSSFALYLDKPFREGDFIVVGQHMGVVKNVGLKTTRIQALQGEEIVISNQELTSTRIQNFKKMDQRRVQLKFGVTYDATPVQLRGVVDTVRSIIESHDNVKFDRAHFSAFGDSSLDFEVIYFVLSGDYVAYMDVQQEINLALYERLLKDGISFAFPTRTVHVVKEG